MSWTSVDCACIAAQETESLTFNEKCARSFPCHVARVHSIPKLIWPFPCYTRFWTLVLCALQPNIKRWTLINCVHSHIALIVCNVITLVTFSILHSVFDCFKRLKRIQGRPTTDVEPDSGSNSVGYNISVHDTHTQLAPMLTAPSLRFAHSLTLRPEMIGTTWTSIKKGDGSSVRRRHRPLTMLRGEPKLNIKQ